VLGRAWAPALALTLAALAIYVRTAAPTVLSGDSAEFQLAAATLGVAHPTTYPLYTMLGALAARLLPFGDMARRVTLVSALCGALAIGIYVLLVQRLGVRRRAALIGALLLAVSPGMWNAATVADVYSLLALLSLLLGFLLACDRQVQPAALLAAGLVAGLGFTHHGLFTITVLPVFGAYLAWRWYTRRRITIAPLLSACLGFTPWLYPALVFARFGPFSGDNYGLPQHYFWGSPTSWGAVLDLVTGGAVRRGIFRFPTLQTAHATLAIVADRAWFEYGLVGLALGLMGWVVMFRRRRLAWAAAMWVFAATLTYLLLLGPAVADAPVFTLPMLLPWAVWVAFGCTAVFDGLHACWPNARCHWPALLVFVALLGASLAWADTRTEFASKRTLTLYREFGETTLAALPPDAVVIAHWEQGMALQYLHLVEQRRPDVWIDVVEPGDAPWEPRARQRYPDRPVYLVGSAQDVETIAVEPVFEQEYASLFRLRSPEP
jgi:hypothetical protein